MQLEVCTFRAKGHDDEKGNYLAFFKNRHLPLYTFFDLCPYPYCVARSGPGDAGPEAVAGDSPYANAGGQASERGKPLHAAANCPTGSKTAPCKHLQAYRDRNPAARH